MRLLAIDTSGPVCGTAVMEEEKVLAEMICQNHYTHSASLMPMAERSLEMAGMRLADLDALAVVTGPGSFTGVRIGVATAKGLAHGSGLPCIPVDALEALAESTGMRAEPLLICPLQDARAGQVYGACFYQGERRTENRAVKLEEFLKAAGEMWDGICLFTGDGAAVHEA